MEQLYLSRRNITTLLDKLDTLGKGETCSCTIIKSDYAHPVYPQSVRRIAVTAVETQDAYFDEVSKRLNLSRASLTLLRDGLHTQGTATVAVEGIKVTAVPNENYYGNDEAGNATALGHITPALVKKWR